MTPQNSAFLEILHKIGAPLVSAVVRQAKDQSDAKKIAESVAELLSKTIKLGADIEKAAEPMIPDHDQGDAIRVALAAIASEIISGQYAHKPETLDEGALENITEGLKATLGFSDNFKLDGDVAKRLEGLDAKALPYDPVQFHLQYINAYVPVVHAVSVFSFGQTKTKLINDIASRLAENAVEIRKNLMAEITDSLAIKQAELSILKALIGLYTSCHMSETKRLQSDESKEEVGSIESVWSAFDLNVAILEAYIGGLLGHAVGVGEPEQGQSDIETDSKKSVDKKDTSAVSEESKNIEEPSSVEAPANPMGFFAPQNKEDESSSQESKQPEEEQKSDASEDSSTESSDGQGDSSNPMSFFGKKSD